MKVVRERKGGDGSRGVILAWGKSGFKGVS